MRSAVFICGACGRGCCAAAGCDHAVTLNANAATSIGAILPLRIVLLHFS
jgi:hypothetical protein